jgi:hypothetical protein
VCAGEVKPTPEGGNQKIKLKVRINPSGVFNVSSAAMIEKVEIEEEVPVQMEVRVPHGLFQVLRIRDIYPGSWYFHPGSQI